MISIATFSKTQTSTLLKSMLAVEGIESTLFDKVSFNSATKVAKPCVSVLINLTDEERAVKIMEELGNQLND